MVLLGGKVQVHQSGFSVKIATDLGVEVSSSGNQYVEITVPASYHNATCGLCGTLDANSDNDFTAPNGSLMASAVLFANTWQVMETREPCGGAQGLTPCPPAELAFYSGSEYCGALKKSPGPFAGCMQVLPFSRFVEICTHSLCKSGGNRTVLCEMLQMLAERCQALSITVGRWRTDTFCGESEGRNQLSETWE